MATDKYKVYRHITPDGKCYVGCTSKSLKERWWEQYKHCPRFKDIAKKYGWNGMEHEIIADNLSKEEAYEIEIQTIAKFKSNNPLYGYNVSKGGKATFDGLKHTKSHREYMSNRLKGIVFSEEHINNLRKGHSGERKAVESIDDDGHKAFYKSLGDAAEAVGGYKSNISRSCANNKKYKERYWSFVKGV